MSEWIEKEVEVESLNFSLLKFDTCYILLDDDLIDIASEIVYLTLSSSEWTRMKPVIVYVLILNFMKNKCTYVCIRFVYDFSMYIYCIVCGWILWSIRLFFIKEDTNTWMNVKRKISIVENSFDFDMN